MKYYTPEVSDLFLGYECELFNWGEYATEICGLAADAFPTLEEWEKYRREEFLKDDAVNNYKATLGIEELTLLIKMSEVIPLFRLIRTPYLTQEQIIAEGFLESEVYGSGFGKVFVKTVHFDTTNISDGVTKEEYVVVLGQHKIDIQRIWHGGFAGGAHRNILFSGKCLSINEFRKFTKAIL